MSLFLIAVGAVLRYAVTTSVSGVSLSTVGLILMIVGIVGLVLAIAWLIMARRPPPAAPLADDLRPSERVVERERLYR